MAYIYQITNDINNKIYIGKTEKTIEKRFAEHCRAAFRPQSEHRPLYIAMRKYGIDHFHIELIEETDNPDEREIFWIEQTGSFKKGYNATRGGDGTKYLDYDVIIATYNNVHNLNKVSQITGTSPDYISDILKLYQITVIDANTVMQKEKGKVVNQYDLNNNFIQSFPSLRAAAKSLNKITTNSEGACSHISQVCRGKRKTAYGFIWKFADINNNG